MSGLIFGDLAITASDSIIISTSFKRFWLKVNPVLTKSQTPSASPIPGEISTDPEIQSIIDDFVFRTSAVLKAKNKKYILFNIKNDHLDKIISILPGLESPSIQSLAKQHWNSVQAVIDESRFWEILTKIKKYGAKDILVMPIEKIIP